MKKDILTIYCDGACSGNPGEAGSGLALYANRNEKPILIYGDYIKNATNNVAELNAFLKALQITYKNRGYKKVIIRSDSKYTIDSITKWAYRWEKQGWKRNGGDIKNLELIKRNFKGFNMLKKKVTIEIEYVKAHAGLEGNELADKMAKLAIEKKSKEYVTFS